MQRKTYVCKRSRMCSYLMERGFSPYKITPDKDNPLYNVYLFTATPELHKAVMEYVISKQNNNMKKEGMECYHFRRVGKRTKSMIE